MNHFVHESYIFKRFTFSLLLANDNKINSSERRTIRSGFGIRCLRKNRILIVTNTNNKAKYITPQGYTNLRKIMEFCNHLKLNPILRYITLILFLACTAAAGMCKLLYLLDTVFYGCCFSCLDSCTVVYFDIYIICSLASHIGYDNSYKIGSDIESGLG